MRKRTLAKRYLASIPIVLMHEDVAPWSTMIDCTPPECVDPLTTKYLTAMKSAVVMYSLLRLEFSAMSKSMRWRNQRRHLELCCINKTSETSYASISELKVHKEGLFR